MSQTRVKICGITRVEDAEAALTCGADAIGLVFYEKSPRYVTLEAARYINDTVGPFVTVVGLFVNASAEQVTTAIEQVGIDLLQFHGDEDEVFCAQFNRPYIRAIRMQPGIDPVAAASEFGSAKGILFDAWNSEKYGGTGETFDWDRVPQQFARPVVLAGGLTPENVAEAISATQPYAVDVSGGVESAPGVKSKELIAEFIRQAKSGNREIL